MEKRRISVYETMKVGLLLAFVGGFLDIYTYLLRGGVFANAQTGNMVLFMLRLSQGDWQAALYYMIPITAFFIGVVLTELMKLHERWHEHVVLLELVVLFLIGWCPLTYPAILINSCISFVCAVQFSTFRKLHGDMYATTFCTGNLRSAVEQMMLFIFSKDQVAKRRCINYFLIIIIFCSGALFAGLIIPYLKQYAIWICCFILSLVAIFLFKENKTS